MATLIIPVGHLLGPYYAGRTLEPARYDVRAGDVVHNLTFDEYTVWSIAHGFTEYVGERRPSRPIVEAQATQLGIADSPAVFQRLVDAGLIAAITVRRQMRAFAETHRAFPLALGLGNSPDELGFFALGRVDQPVAAISPDVFHVWSYLPRYPTLWDAATQTAEQIAVAGARLSPEEVLWSFTQALPALLATNSIFFDRA